MARYYFEDELSELPGETAPENLEVEAPSALEKPFLRASDLGDGPRKEVVVLEWMNFLLSKNDLEGLLEVLSNYVEMGWISREVRGLLISYVGSFLDARRGIFSEIKVGRKRFKIGERKSEEEKASENDKVLRYPPQSMTLKDHTKSLAYIIELVKNKVDRDTYKEIMEKAGLELAS